MMHHRIHPDTKAKEQHVSRYICGRETVACGFGNSRDSYPTYATEFNNKASGEENKGKTTDGSTKGQSSMETSNTTTHTVISALDPSKLIAMIAIIRVNDAY